MAVVYVHSSCEWCSGEDAMRAEAFGAARSMASVSFTAGLGTSAASASRNNDGLIRHVLVALCLDQNRRPGSCVRDHRAASLSWPHRPGCSGQDQS